MAAAEIRQKPVVDAGELGFITNLFVQTSLPHRDVSWTATGEPVTAWTRRNGLFSLTIQNGQVFNEATKRHEYVGLPFGTYARLLFAWLGTEAVRTQSPRIGLGGSFGAFMRNLQIPRSGGPKGSEAALRNQLHRITRASLSWEYAGPVPRGATQRVDAGQRIFPIESHAVFWDPNNPDRHSTWESELTLNQVFFEHLVRHHVPVDMRVIRTLAQANAPLAMDIYVWLTSRMFTLQRATPMIPWPKLMEQMGSTHRNPSEFAREFKEHATKVLVLYPDAHLLYVKGGVRLKPSPTHVPVLAAVAAGPERG
ncbi:replication protein RepA (plasmid) [Myxococcus sp. MxC21-1]|uniref:replication protein RepA n=1 Tax=Myxococcus sp. MxC21-1 TaxID=3041439 RepID=UPI0029310A91|nr:replication protein RepA [Myxococcus sp. MxC21-1]WNZ66231.1 replication protein RepA [Myxococcus sp. MxC21-1]